MYVQNDILASLDAGHSTALLLLDLSAAFDTIDHSILTHRLQHWFGISSTAFNLLSSFLSDRFQTVITPASKSNPVLLEYGVPQGSVLGLLLYSLHAILSNRMSGSGGGVAIYIHSSISYHVIDKSCFNNTLNNIDYVLIELPAYHIVLCCMYCPPKTKPAEIVNLITLLKSKFLHTSHFVCTGDFNINLLDENTCFANDFLNDLHDLSLHPSVSLLTRVTNSTATLIDNFLIDFDLLPAKSGVLKTDISDHYGVILFLKTFEKATTSKIRNFSIKNKLNFSNKLSTVDWSSLYNINGVDKAFSYFIKKLKRIYNNCFSFITVTIRSNKPHWLTSGLLKSIRHKNKLFSQSKSNPELKPFYLIYRNRLCKIIRNAKQQFYYNFLIQYKNNSAKLWSYLNSLIKSKGKAQIPIQPETLNDFFTSVFKQAPVPKNNNCHTVPNKSFVTNSFFLTPLCADEILTTMHSFQILKLSVPTG